MKQVYTQQVDNVGGPDRAGESVDLRYVTHYDKRDSIDPPQGIEEA
jgi:hypothetical protein